MSIDTNFIINDTLHLARNFHTDSVFILNNLSEPDTVFVAKDFSKNWWTRNQPWLALVTTLLTFILGYVVANANEKRKKIKRLKQIQNYVFMWLLSNKRAFKVQTSELWRWAYFKDIDETKFVYKKSGISIDKISELDKVELAEAFVFGRRAKTDKINLNKLSFDLINNIDLIILVNEIASMQHFVQFKEKFIKYAEQVTELTLEFYDLTKKFIANHLTIYKEYSGRTLSTDELNKFYELAKFLKEHNSQYLKKFRGGGNIKLSNLRDLYYPPIQEVFSDYKATTENLFDVKILEEMYSQCIKITSILKGVENVMNIHRALQYNNFLKMNYFVKVIFRTMYQYKRYVGFKNWWEL